MSRLGRYVSLTVLSSMLLVQALLLGLDLVFSFIGELDNVKGGYGALDAFSYTLYVLPRHAYSVLPMSALIGALVGLGTLASSSELTVMRAAGISIARIVAWVMAGALSIILMGLALGEFVVPVTDQRAETLKARAQGQDYTPGRISGYWQREGQELINIQLVTPEGQLLGVSRYRYDEQGLLQEASFAASGDYAGKTGWQLRDLRITHFQADGSSTFGVQAHALWPVRLTPDFLRVAAADPEQLGLADLRLYSRYLHKQGLDAGNYELQFWKKALSPLAVFSMVLIACSFIFGPLRSVTLGLRIITGVLVGLVFRYSQDAAGFASLLFHGSPFWATLLPITLCLMAGSYAIYRVR